MVRPPCCDHKLNMKRGLWTSQEDAKILAYVAKHGTGNWTALPKKAGLQRCGKSCRLRWTNYLRPDLKHDSFTPQEEEMIVRLHAAIGSRWSIIAQQLPGRTDNDVKNYWNTRLRKKLSEMGIDPVTHKPFSQILADYGNIGGLLKSRSRIGSLSKDLKNASTSKPEFCPSQPEGISNTNNSQYSMETTALTLSKMEPIQECFLNNSIFNNDTNDSHHYSLDLLDQLKAIKLVTEASNCIEVQENMSPYNFLNEVASLPISASSSPESSTCSTAAQENLQASFSWSDFLLEDAFHIPTEDHPQEDQTMVEFSPKDLIMSQQQNVVVTCQGQNETNYCHQVNDVRVEGMDLEVLRNNGFDDHDQAVSSFANSSFVETILDLESKMLLDFPHLVDEPFYY